MVGGYKGSYLYFRGTTAVIHGATNQQWMRVDPSVRNIKILALGAIQRTITEVEAK